MFIALLTCSLAPMSSMPSPTAIPTGQAVVDAATIDAGAMPAADTSSGVSSVQDDQEAEDVLVRVDAFHRATTPLSVEPRVPGVSFLREHRLAMELRPPIV